MSINPWEVNLTYFYISSLDAKSTKLTKIKDLCGYFKFVEEDQLVFLMTTVQYLITFDILKVLDYFK